MIRSELDIKVDQEFFWTDSQVVLGYLNNEARKFHIFVANRVQRIRACTDPNQWHYVPTESNPADFASRGLSAKEIQNTCWFSGPTFLWEKNVKMIRDQSPELQANDPEVRNATTLLQIQMPASTNRQFDWNERLSHCSSWNMAVRVVARIGRLTKCMKFPKELSLGEIQNAKHHIIRGLQRTLSREELRNLDAFQKDSIIRVGGRLGRSSLPTDERHPIVLPQKGHLIRLIIAHHHRNVKHAGKGLTLSEIRAHGWYLVKGAKQVARYIKECVTCRKVRGAPLEQKMADLPEERTDPSPPFTHTGMDCFGPIIVKNGRREMKRYGLLLTCFSSRAVHIEMLDDLNNGLLHQRIALLHRPTWCSEADIFRPRLELCWSPK